MYDLIIIGGGPAGVAATVYAARKQLKTLSLVKEFGGQSIVSPLIFNWIGTTEISGIELASNLKKHAKEYEGEYLDIKEGAEVSVLDEKGKGFVIKTEDNIYESKTVLICSGSSRRKLSVPGADKLENKGITYCASCDGPLFADKDVVVIGGGNAGFETAAQLLAYTSSVTLLHRSAEYKADAITTEKVLAHPNMKGIKNVDITHVLGDKFVEGLEYKDSKTGKQHKIKTQGVFIEIGQIPNTSFVESAIKKDDYQRIVIDPTTQKTSIAGIWAAGDCTDVLYHQNNIAAGDSVRAVENIYVSLHAR